MQPTSTEREEKYRSAPESVREAYAGEQIGESLRAIFDSHQLREELYREYALAFGDVVLGFVDASRMATLLRERMNIPEPVATHLAAELKKLLPSPAPGETTGTQDVAAQQVSEVAPANPIKKSVPASQTAPAWTHVAEPAVPETQEPEVVDDKPFYPRVPNYSKPMTNPAPRAPQDPRANDPYHEPIE